MSRFLKLSVAAIAVGVVGCSFHARGPDNYRNDTAALLATKRDQIQSCYTEVLKQNKNAGGRVGVKFTVQSETGKIVDPEIEPGLTTAPPELGQCVISAIDGLALKPPDERDGIATFVYDFNAKPAPAPATPAG